MTQTPPRPPGDTPPPPGGTPPPPPGGSPPPPPGGTAPPPGAVPPPPGQPPGFAAPAGNQTEGLAIGALICAIAGFFFLGACGLGLILAIVALVLASNSSKKIAASGGRLTGAGLNTAARIIAWIDIGLAVLGIALIIILAATGNLDDDDDDDFDNDFGLGTVVKLTRVGVLAGRAIAGFFA